MLTRSRSINLKLNPQRSLSKKKEKDLSGPPTPSKCVQCVVCGVPQHIGRSKESLLWELAFFYTMQVLGLKLKSSRLAARLYPLNHLTGNGLLCIS